MTRLRLCGADELAPGEMRRVERPGHEAVAVYNIDGRFYATDDTCTHARANLTDGDLEGDEVVCPVHEGVFHVPTGTPMCFPVSVALATYRVEVEHCVVWARLDESAAEVSA